MSRVQALVCVSFLTAFAVNLAKAVLGYDCEDE